MKVSIYFAAPLFTHAERMWNKKLADAMLSKCESLKIILPQEETKIAINENEINYTKLFKICLEGIDLSDIVLAILDGADSDSGTCFECGYAFAKGKNLIGVRTDLRAGEVQGLNAMLAQSTQVIEYSSVHDREEDIDILAEIIIDKIKNIKIII
jgi:nucleoside 2-deoxyribosyltransferase